MNEKPNRILEFLTSPARPEGEASRTNRRRHSSAFIEISWPEGDDWRKIRARLRDISRAGAGAVAASPPPLTDLARLRLVDGDGTPWVEVEILGVEALSRKRHRIRLRFIDPCPSFVLRQAVLGNIPAIEDNPGVPLEWVAWNPGRPDWPNDGPPGPIRP